MSGAIVTSYVALWLIVGIQCIVLFEVLRQIGILRRRMPPEPGALLAGEGLDRGALIPHFVAMDLQSGQPFSDEQIRGRRALLVFLEPGCHSCQLLGPDLREFARSYAGEVEIVVICPGTAENCTRFMRMHKLQIPVLFDEDQRVSEVFQARRTPSATLIDEAGRIRIHGIPNNLQQLEGLLREEGTPMGRLEWQVMARESTMPDLKQAGSSLKPRMPGHRDHMEIGGESHGVTNRSAS